jgi:DNA-binding XRE family transcriptional regulator
MRTPPRMLRIARELLGKSQDMLAAELGLTPRAVQRAEATDPSLSLERQSLFLEYFRKNGIIFLSPGAERFGWAVAEGFNRGELRAPARLFRAARIGLDLSQQKLGIDADLGTMTIRRIESDKKTVEPETRQFLVDFLRSRGVHFLPPSEAMGWVVCFAGIVGEPRARHPRLSVQKRKREVPG